MKPKFGVAAAAKQVSGVRDQVSGKAPAPGAGIENEGKRLARLYGAAGAGAYAPYFIYHGGPIIDGHDLRVIFVGAWGADLQKKLVQFISDLLTPTGGWMNVLRQYGVGDVAETSVISMAHASGVVSDAEARQLVRTHRAGTQFVLLMLGQGIALGAPGAFAYHDWFYDRLTWVRYGVVPALDDAMVTRICAGVPAGGRCALSVKKSQLDRLTQVISHEIAEALSDPRLDAWYAIDLGHENGDLCNGMGSNDYSNLYQPFTVNGWTWNVQAQYSKRADEAGKLICVMTAPEPLETYPLAPGNSIFSRLWRQAYLGYRIVRDNLRV